MLIPQTRYAQNYETLYFQIILTTNQNNWKTESMSVMY